MFLGVFTAAEPMWSGFGLFYLSIFLSGLGGGIWDSGNSVWTVEMWKDNSAPVLQLSQMMYGCGAIIAPLLVEPFIYGDLSKKDDNTGTTASALNMTTLSAITTNTSDDINYSVDRRSKMRVPFFVGGGLTLISELLSIQISIYTNNTL